MPLLISAGDRVDIWVIGDFNAQRIMNTFSWGVELAPAAGVDWDNFVTTFNTHLVAAGSLIPAIRQATPVSYVITEIWYQYCNIAGRFRLTKRAHNLEGQWPVAGSTANLAGVITRRGDLAQRNNQSNLHILAPSDTSAATGGVLTQAYKSALETIKAEIMEVRIINPAAGAVSLVPVIANGPLATQVTPITTVDVQSTMRVMRRRTVGLGI